GYEAARSARARQTGWPQQQGSPDASADQALLPFPPAPDRDQARRAAKSQSHRRRLRASGWRGQPPPARRKSGRAPQAALPRPAESRANSPSLQIADSVPSVPPAQTPPGVTAGPGTKLRKQPHAK